MASSERSKAHVVLEAVRYAANGDIPALRQLSAIRADVLKIELTLRILLTYLPVATEPKFYTDFIRDLPTFSSQTALSLPSDSPLSPEPGITDNEARRRVRRLHLLALGHSLDQNDEDADPLTLFLLHQARRIDAETGSLELASQLLGPFVNHSEILRTWMISNLLPILRLDYEYYPHSGPTHSLWEFENLDAALAVPSLLSKAVQRNDPGDKQKIGRDLSGLIGPWMYGERSRKRRKLNQRNRRKSSIPTNDTMGVQMSTENEDRSNEWSLVNDWLIDLSNRDFQKSVDAITEWNGPNDVDYGDWGNGVPPLNEEDMHRAILRYGQAALASLYATNTSSLETIIGSHRILVQTARLLKIDEPPDLKRTDTPIVSGIDHDFFDSISPAKLFHNALLLPQNPLTLPSDNSIILSNLLLASAYKFLNLGHPKACRAVLELAMFSSEVDQKAELRKTLHKLKAEKLDEGVWASVRRQILWLRNWEQDGKTAEVPQGVFSKVSLVDIEMELLRAILDGGCNNLAIELYCSTASPSLPSNIVEGTVLHAALSAYDAASNGNRTRGGVRKASEIMSTFRVHFPNSLRFQQTISLVSATHAMSFYSLTLQHGVPFLPVNVRAHEDPMSLIGKILSQNPQSYTHLDDLLEIGQNLVAAGLTRKSREQGLANSSFDAMQDESVAANRRIIRMAIQAALEEDDFDTAYSYIVTRLSGSGPPKPILSAESEKLLAGRDDDSWRAAYQAGRFSPRSPGSLSLRRLEQRLELLSSALLLAPPAALSEVLTAWQECERDMIARISREVAEDERWDAKGDHKIPGGFTADSVPIIQKARDPTRGALVEEAPMGLFDVARGAAAALSKSTFPLRRNGPVSPTKSSLGRPLSTASADSSDEESISGAAGPGRARKRDMVSNMVTGGLVSGIGWVIGAPPARQE